MYMYEILNYSEILPLATWEAAQIHFLGHNTVQC